MVTPEQKLADAADVVWEAYLRGWHDAWAKAKAEGIAEGLQMAADWRQTKVATPNDSKETR